MSKPQLSPQCATRPVKAGLLGTVLLVLFVGFQAATASAAQDEPTPEGASTAADPSGEETSGEAPGKGSDGQSEVPAESAESEEAPSAGSASNADAALLAQVAKSREQILAAAEGQFKRSVSCTWSPAALPGKRLTCGPHGLLLSGGIVSDVLIEGLPVKANATVTATLAERGPSLKSADQFDTDRGVFRDDDGGPVVIEVHAHRRFSPTHGGCKGSICSSRQIDRARVERRRGYRKLLLISTYNSERMFVAVKVDGYEQADVVPIPIGVALWKFDTSGFIGLSKVTDQEVRSHADPADSSKVIVDGIEPADEYSQESGVLVTFVPQNYQAFGFAFGFATNNSQSPSVYLGLSMRMRTFGDKAIASFGVGQLLKSVKRFPGLNDALGADGSIAADSALLAGKSQLQDGWAALISVGFSFGPIKGAASE